MSSRGMDKKRKRRVRILIDRDIYALTLIYINVDQSWTTMDMGRFFSEKNAVTDEQLSSLLRGKKFSPPQGSVYDRPYDVKVPVKIDQHVWNETDNQEDIEELEAFCKKSGIIGVNFGKMSPRQVLNMLKGRRVPPTGPYESTKISSQKGLLNG